MSLSLWLECTCNRSCCIGAVAEFNVTYNLSPMWCAATTTAEPMLAVDGLAAAKSLPKLTRALNTLESDPQHFEGLNPSNGWGSYKTLCSTLREIIAAAKEHPEARWRASR